jgi:N-acetylglucosaminyl-diphospho-decaprenol L-rhamnosyltransferase
VAQQRPLDVAVVTVIYKAAPAYVRCAESVEQSWALLPDSHRGRLRLMAVDNGSVEDRHYVRDRAPSVEVIELPGNRGFAAACNAAIRGVPDDALIVLLNPDVRVQPDFFQNLQRLGWPADVAAVGPCVMGADGDLEQSARRFPTASTGIFGRTTLLSRLLPQSRPVRRQLLAERNRPLEVDWVSGACFIAPRQRFHEVGLLDEGYFLYWEDADWCRRAHAIGYHILYRPELVVHHQQGTGGSAHDARRSIVAFHRSAYRYYLKHISRSRLSAAAAGLALASRCGGKLAAQRIGALIR